MPKQTIRKEDVLKASVEITRSKGFEFVNARSVAEYIGKSVQPIYSYFDNMDELKGELYSEAMAIYDSFITARTDAARPMESMAAANIEFAKNETRLFRLLFLSKLEGLKSFSDIFDKMGDRNAAAFIAQKYGLTESEAKEVYIMLIVFTHGIATLIATGGADIDAAESQSLTEKAFHSFIESHYSK